MTTSDWIIDIALIFIVVRQLRAERLTTRFVLLPLGIVAYVAHSYLHALPTAGNDLVLIGLCVLLGSALGLAGGLLTRVTARGGEAYVQARFGAAALWVGSMAARLGFIVWITHSGQGDLMRFSADHHITGATTWQDALVLLALSEVLVRVGTIVIRGLRAKAASLDDTTQAGQQDAPYSVTAA